MTEQDEKKRKFLVDALTLGLFAGVGTAGVLNPAFGLSGLPDRLPKGQSIYRLSGEVLVDGRPADLKTRVNPGSVIRTGADGEIVFVVASDAFILRANSEVQLTASGLLIQSMRIISGALLGVFGKRDDGHRIETSVATIGIRGTGIYIESGKDKTYACTCYGRTRISPNANPSLITDVETSHHDMPLYIVSEPVRGKFVFPAPVINHSDQELALIEALVGRKTPFAQTGYGLQGNGGGY